MFNTRSRSLATLLVTCGLAAACAPPAAMKTTPQAAQATKPVPAAIVAQLAPGGTLRAAINYNNPLLATRDAATGELSGVAVDLSRELARRLGVQVQLIPVEAAGKITDSAATGNWDIGYLAIDPGRATQLTFTAAYIELEGMYLVPPGSTLQNAADVDRDGIRVAVTAKSAYDLYLTRALKHAQLVRADNTPASMDMMLAQKLDAVAAVRTATAAGMKRIPGSRVLNGHFMTIPQAAAVPAGRPLAAQYAQQFIEEMKASGFVAAALKNHGLGPDDAIVAPAADAPAPATP
jgi:polar amino acid transport system substrate-binding protein